jgi:perosamine synthetase
MAKFKLPNARYRIYSSVRTYLMMLRELLFSGSDGQPGVTELESELCRRLGVRAAVCVPQNRLGVYLTLRHTIRSGQGVIMSPYTIADIINMVICAGGRPIFADVERSTCNISAKEVEFLLRTSSNVGAVLVTDLHGLVSPCEEISKLCESFGVPLIEDSAQAFGSKLEGRLAGTFGRAGVFSFGMYKNVNSFYGGAVVSNDEELISLIRDDLQTYPYQSVGLLLARLRQGLLTDTLTSPIVFKLLTFWIFRFGFLNDIEFINKRVRIELDVSPKSVLPDTYFRRMRPCQARVVLSQLKDVDARSKVRIGYSEIYFAGLPKFPGLILPPQRGDFSHIYTYFPIQYSDRQALLKFMMLHGRDAAAQHYKNCADLPGYSEFYRDCPNARAVSESLIFLPTYPRYGREQVEKNVEVLQAFFRQAGGRVDNEIVKVAA